MEKQIKMGIHNRFDIVVRDAATGNVKREYQAENIILNQFWPKFISSSCSIFSHIHIGGGTAQPIASDTTLTSLIIGRAATTILLDNSKIFPDSQISLKKSIRIQDTEYIGTTISEVGIAYGTTGNNLMTKALVKDMNGNVVSIVKGDGEIIDIFATLYFSWAGFTFASNDFFILPPGLTQGGNYESSIFTILMGLNTNWDLLRYNSGFYFNYTFFPRRPPQFLLAGSAIECSASRIDSYISAAYDVPNKKVSWSLQNLTTTMMNLAGGIRGLLLMRSIGIKLPTTGLTQPVITKEIVATGDGIKTGFRTKFGFIKDNGTFNVYVNDVLVPSTPVYNRPNAANVAGDLIMIDAFDYQTPSANLDYRIPAPSRSANSAYALGSYSIHENPYYNVADVTSITSEAAIIMHTSDDLVNWVQVTNKTTIAVEHRRKRYWKAVVGGDAAQIGWTGFNIASFATDPDFVLATAPAIDSVITCTYQPDVLAKDDQHVINNIVMSISFNEYTPV